MKQLQKTGEQLLASIAYGDARGLPVETKSFLYIAENFENGVDKLYSASDNIYYKGDYPAGKTSDDLQLSASLAKALIRSDGFDINTVADETIIAYFESVMVPKRSGKLAPLGWGGSTTNSVESMINNHVSPLESGEPNGEGNGILMKMAPLVFWQVARGIDEAERHIQYDQLTTMTHDGDVARVCTRIHGDILYALLTEEVFDFDTLSERVVDLAKRHETILQTSSEVSDILTFLLTNPTPEDVQNHYLPRAEGVTDAVFGKSYSFYSPETLLVAYVSFLNGRGDYEKSVNTAVNLGGDADSTASIVGAMVNFLRKGSQEMPQDVEQVQDIENIRALSSELARRALRIS